MGLTPKQERFVAEYLVDLNATQAATRAGYSAKTAYSVGNENLSKPEIAEAIAKARTRQLQQADISAVRVLEELRRLSFSDLSRLVDVQGRLLPLHEMPEDVRASIASVKLTKKNLTTGDGVVDDVIEVKLWDKVRSLEMLAKHFKLLTDVVQVQDAQSAIQRLHEGRARVAAARRAKA